MGCEPLPEMSRGKSVHPRQRRAKSLLKSREGPLKNFGGPSYFSAARRNLRRPVGKSGEAFLFPAGRWNLRRAVGLTE
jgi:hypothetical protein